MEKTAREPMAPRLVAVKGERAMAKAHMRSCLARKEMGWREGGREGGGEGGIRGMRSWMSGSWGEGNGKESGREGGSEGGREGPGRE
jgi:hypothetical protein